MINDNLSLKSDEEYLRIYLYFSAVFATGARDGAIMLWDIRANHTNYPKPDNCIYNSHSAVSSSGTKSRRSHSQASRTYSITSLVFQDDFTLISCAAGDGYARYFNF